MGVCHFDLLDSTNLQAKRQRDEWLLDRWTLITAESQTAGYGRQGRRWLSPPGGNIYCTYLYASQREFRYGFAHAAQAAGVAAATVLERHSGCAIELKWPNDIIIKGKKVGGILTEGVGRRDGAALLVVGIGLNINATEEDLKGAGQPATSLSIATGHRYNCAAVLTELNSEVPLHLTLALDEGFKPIREAYTARLTYTMGETINVTLPNGENCLGTYLGLNDEGALIILSKGKVISVY